jgi:hypothetical protein
MQPGVFEKNLPQKHHTWEYLSLAWNYREREQMQLLEFCKVLFQAVALKGKPFNHAW